MSVSFHTRDIACVAVRVILRFLTVIALFLRASCVICDESVVMRATAFATVQQLVLCRPRPQLQWALLSLSRSKPIAIEMAKQLQRAIQAASEKLGGFDGLARARVHVNILCETTKLISVSISLQARQV